MDNGFFFLLKWALYLPIGSSWYKFLLFKMCRQTIFLNGRLPASVLKTSPLSVFLSFFFTTTHMKILELLTQNYFYMIMIILYMCVFIYISCCCLSSSEYPSPSLKRPSSILFGEERTPQMTHLPLECQPAPQWVSSERVPTPQGGLWVQHFRTEQDETGKNSSRQTFQPRGCLLDMDFLGWRGWMRTCPAIPSAGSSLSSLHQFLLLSSPTLQPKPPMQLWKKRK